MYKKLLDILKPLGLAFGDIGTSPIYTLPCIFATLPANKFNVIGVLSLIIWTLLLLPLLQYSVLAMSLSKRGEGGSIVLFEILSPLLKSGRSKLFFALLTYTGISLLIGDGVITPSISILSAVEGATLSFPISKSMIVLVSILISSVLFYIQKNGSNKVSKIFGPVMLLWFIVLGITGLVSIFEMPSILEALNPLYGIKFLTHHNLHGLFVLSEVILCATGVEALYADMGHLKCDPIRHSLYFVLIVLILNYLGQGAFLLAHQETGNIIFNMVMYQISHFYVQFLILSVFATVVASQAMISGVFSIVYQGITTKIIPSLKINYTSEQLRSQIYLPIVNKFLFLFVIIIICIFKSSGNLAAAYGFAVTGTMSITALLMTTIFFFKNSYSKAAVSLILLFIDLVFFSTSISKISQGGYWSIVIAAFPFILILVYSMGQKMLLCKSNSSKMNTFISKFTELYSKSNHINGTALFFIKETSKIPEYINRTILNDNILYEENILVHIRKTSEPYGIIISYKTLDVGLKLFQIDAGYMEIINIDNILTSENIYYKVIFYCIEEIDSNKTFWKIFAFIKKISSSFVGFYKLPSNKLHGVTNRTLL